jgi:hypothetical protein
VRMILNCASKHASMGGCEDVGQLGRHAMLLLQDNAVPRGQGCERCGTGSTTMMITLLLVLLLSTPKKFSTAASTAVYLP